MWPVLFKHEDFCIWDCMNSFLLYILISTNTIHHLCALCIILNWLLWKFHNIWIHLVGVVTSSLKPVYMIYRGVSAPSPLQVGIESAGWFYYTSFSHNNAYCHSIATSIICSLCSGSFWFILFHPGSHTTHPMYFITWGHD